MSYKIGDKVITNGKLGLILTVTKVNEDESIELTMNDYTFYFNKGECAFKKIRINEQLKLF